MSLINFESSRDIERKRQEIREARSRVLEKAKQKHEAEQERKEKSRQQGEHIWMLPSVEAKLESFHKEKKKKKKEKKKRKKEKKSKKAKKRSSSSSSSGSEEEQWIEKPAPKILSAETNTDLGQTAVVTKVSPDLQRDSWMQMGSLFPTYTREELRDREGSSRQRAREEEKREKLEAEKPGTHSRELNPYYKDGGKGLPEVDEEAPTKPSVSAVALDSSWLHKALKRAKEQAEVTGKSLEEVAAVRWGSLAAFKELLAKAEEKEQKGNESRNTHKPGSASDRSRSKSRENSEGRYHSRRSRRSRTRSRSRSRDRRKSRIKDRRKCKSRQTDSRSRSQSSRSRSRSKERINVRKSKDYLTKDKRASDVGHGYQRSQSRERNRSSSSDRTVTLESKDKHLESRSYTTDSASMKTSQKRSQEEDQEGQSFRHMLCPSRGSLASKDYSQLMMVPQREMKHNRFAWDHSDDPGKYQSPGRWKKKAAGGQDTEKHFIQKEEKSSSESSDSSDSDADKAASPAREKLESQPSKEASSHSEVTSSPHVQLTDKQMNELAAKLTKAELLGNESAAQKLRKKLEEARAVQSAAMSRTVAQKDTGTKEAQEQVVILTKTNAAGYTYPVSLTEAKKKTKQRKKKMYTHDADGKRISYFPDDEKHDLRQMFEKEKETSAQDQIAMFSRAAMQNTESLNEEYDFDDMFMSKAASKEDSAKQQERERKKVIEEHQRTQRSLESCQWCFENKEMPKHLIVSLGSKAYVCLPPYQSLTPGHCMIIPIHHVLSATHADEDLWNEILSFRRSLVQMFSARNEDCIFFERAAKLRNYPHMVLQCVPLSKEMGDQAPIYFKKAIQECEKEWSQNKKLVDLKERDVRRSIPKGLPYFFVDFGMSPGYAHVIEDEHEFPRHFAQEIVGGMMDLEPNVWRKPRRETFDLQRKKVMQFAKWYEEFDPTTSEL